ncbi:MAG: TonB-dependent receptor, partial [Chitinophagaceae bacterium]
STRLVTRLGGGLGYKTPTVFSEETERVQFRNLLPLNASLLNNERSVGANWDLNYTTTIGGLDVALNHLFFYTRLKQPMILVQAPGNNIAFENADGYLDTKGIETNLRFTFHDFKLFIGYTYTNANTHYNATKKILPLTAKHRLNNVLMYEAEEKWKIGLEAYYFDAQHLSDGTKGKQYWIFGLMAEKLWKNFSLFINFENFTDTRQTRFGPIYSGTIDAPSFLDIYAPVDGFVVNGGFKIRL